MQANAPIGIFDSGLGGLAVMREVMDLLPNEDMLYLGDTMRQPYGPQTVEQVRQYTLEICGYLISRGAKLVLIGCNTASVAGWADAQEAFPGIPIIGMLNPGVNAALRVSKERRVGVWGTEITIASKAYDDLLMRNQSDVKVVGVACPTLLRLAEKGNIGDRPYLRSLITHDLEPVLRHGADTLILGCTDFTCVRDIVDEVVQGRLEIVDPAEEVAREAKKVLLQENALRQYNDNLKYEFLVTGDDRDNFAAFGARFLGLPSINVDQIPLQEVQAGASASR
jgi:glutamate racemase